MRRGLLIIGILVLVVGLVLVVLPFLSSTTEAVPPGYVYKFTPTFLGSGTVTVSWSGEPATTQVELYSCADAACGSGNAIATGQGSSGSISASLQGGQSYGIQTSGSAGASVALTLKAVGLSPLVLVGVVLLVIGAIVAVLAFRRRAPAAPGAAAPAPAETAAEPEAATAAPAETPAASASAPAPAAAPGTRPPLQCSYCGTLNEVWLTNCRKCKRPLKTTG